MTAAPSFFWPLTPHSYDSLVADPPWPFETWSDAGQRKSASQHYRTMPVSDIKALPIGELLKKDAVVFLWATAPRLPQALAALECSGIAYKTHLIWRKVTRTGKVRMGCGFWARTMHEVVLLGTVGKPRKITFSSIFDGIAREHSRKPDEFYQMVTERTPGYRRVDLFARERRDGWDVWGDEVDRFDIRTVDKDERALTKSA